MTFTPPTASHFIYGQYVEDTDGPVIDLIYPATGAVLGQVHGATSDIIEQALQSA